MFTNEEIKAILECLEYTATHKYKKDNIAQAMLGELSCKVEECLGYEDDSMESEMDYETLKKMFDFWNDLDVCEGGNNG